MRNLVRTIASEDIARIHTMQLGVVTKVESDGRVRVRPLNVKQISQADNEDRFDYGDPPELPARPVTTLSGAGGAMRVKVAVGDLVRVEHMMYPIDEHLQQDVRAPVRSERVDMHDLSDCTVTPIQVRGTLAPIGDVDIESDDLRLGHPADAEALVLESSQARLNTYHTNMLAMIEAACAAANSGTFVSLSALGPSYVAAAPQLVSSEHVKAS